MTGGGIFLLVVFGFVVIAAIGRIIANRKGKDESSPPT